LIPFFLSPGCRPIVKRVAPGYDWNDAEWCMQRYRWGGALSTISVDKFWDKVFGAAAKPELTRASANRSKNERFVNLFVNQYVTIHF
jgi:hypothetical protein